MRVGRKLTPDPGAEAGGETVAAVQHFCTLFNTRSTVRYHGVRRAAGGAKRKFGGAKPIVDFSF